MKTIAYNSDKNNSGGKDCELTSSALGNANVDDVIIKIYCLRVYYGHIR